MRNPFRRRSALDLSPGAKVLSYVLLLGWTFVVLFPIYWLAVTSLQLPIQVNSGPVFFPFIDFQPTLENWRYIFVDLRNDTVRPYINTVVVGLSSAIVALALGSSAAYALVRFHYRPRVAVIGLFVGCLVLAFGAMAVGVPPELAVLSAIAVFVILAQTIGRRFR